MPHEHFMSMPDEELQAALAAEPLAVLEYAPERLTLKQYALAVLAVFKVALGRQK